MKYFSILIYRYLYLGFFKKSETYLSLVFFIISICLFPICIGPDLKTLSQIGIGAIWICYLFTSMLFMDEFFKNEILTGHLKTFLLTSKSFPLFIFIKCLSHWLLFGLPLLFLIPVFFLLLGIKYNFLILIKILGISIIITQILTWISAIGSSLTVNLKERRLISILTLIPLYIPVLIFSTSTYFEIIYGEETNTSLYILIIYYILIQTITPFLIPKIIKFQI